MKRASAVAFTVSIFVFSSLVLTPAYAIIQCPEPHEEYESILRKLKDFEARLAPQPECRSIQSELSDLRAFYSSNVKRLKTGLRKTREDVEVTEEEAQALSDYSTGVAEKVSSLIAALEQDHGKCVSKEKQPSFLSSLASIARSATGLVGSYSGPYDIPIRVGGSLFAGILLGIDRIINDDSKYDFNDADLQQLFVKNLCIYHDIRQEIQNTIEPVQRIRMYITIIKLLQEKEEVILEACLTSSKNCEEYRKRYEAKETVQYMVDSLKFKTDEACAKADSPWAQCAMLSDIIFHSQSMMGTSSTITVSNDDDATASNEVTFSAAEIGANGEALPEPKDIFESILNEVKKTQSSGVALSQMEETYQKISSNGFIPSRIDCWDLSAEEVEVKNKRTRGIIDDIARMAVEHFEARLQEMLWDPGDESVHEKRNYALWLDKTYKKRDWAVGELFHMIELLGTNGKEYVSSKRELTKEVLDTLEYSIHDGSDAARQQIRLMMNQLDGRILKDLAPQYISWNIKQAGKSMEAYQKRRRQEQSNMRAKLQSALSLRLNNDISISDLLKIVQCPEGGKGLPNEVCSNFASNVSDLLNEMGIVKNSLGATAVYCDFFNKAGTMNDNLLKACSSPDHQQTQRTYEALAPERQAFEDYIDWCHIQNKIDGDNARDVIERIKSFVDETKQMVPKKN